MYICLLLSLLLSLASLLFQIYTVSSGAILAIGHAIQQSLSLSFSLHLSPANSAAERYIQ